MIIRKGEPPSDQGSEWRAEEFGAFESLHYSDAGGLTQFGAYVETLQPGVAILRAALARKGR